MKEIIDIAKKDKIIFYGFLVSLILMLLNIIYIFVSYSKLPPFIPLFNQLPWGDLRLGTKEQIFIPFLISLFIMFINYLLAAVFYEKMPLISRHFCVTSTLISALTFLFIIRTIQLII